MLFKGSMVALVTPMLTDGSIDKVALTDLIEWHISAKTSAIVIAGTTGESATLDPDEQYDLVKFAVEQSAGRIPIIAGAGTNSTRTTLNLINNAKRAGATATLVVTPYYNKPTQKGLIAHYQTIAEQGDMPVILYNVPGRTGCDLLPETVAQLARHPQIIGIKEATGKLERISEIAQRCGSSFGIYSGDDATAMDAMLIGAHGVISVTSNVAPEKMAAMCHAAVSGDKASAETINAELMGLHERLFLESNPIPAKWVLSQMGRIQSGIRLPLLPLDSQFHQPLHEAMQQAGVN